MPLGSLPHPSRGGEARSPLLPASQQCFPAGCTLQFLGPRIPTDANRVDCSEYYGLSNCIFPSSRKTGWGMTPTNPLKSPYRRCVASREVEQLPAPHRAAG